MDGNDFKSILPHGPSMVALDQVLERGESSIIAAAVAGKLKISEWHSGARALIPAWSCIELIAQCAALGNLTKDAGAAQRSGVVARVRNLEMNETWIERGTKLKIAVQWESKVAGVFNGKALVTDFNTEKCLVTGEVLIVETRRT